MRLFTFLLLGQALMAQDAADADGWIQRGVQAFQNAKYADAVRAFEQALALEPHRLNARLYLGTAYMQQYIPGAQSTENQALANAASREFRRVLEMDAQNTLAMASLASLDLNDKKWDEAQQWFEKLITVEPGNADAHYSLGFIAWSKWYPAFAEARKISGMRREDPGPLPDGPNKQDLKAKYMLVIDEGLRSLQRALESRPSYADAMAYINLLIRERADLRDTKEEYQRDIAEADQWVEKALAAKRTMPVPAPQRIRVAEGIAAETKIRHVPPEYPPLALRASISGSVRIAIVIGKDGKVSDMKVISGHPLLIPAALEAVKQWEYKPTSIHDQPVEVSTEVAVDFKLP